jgi:glycosyltransferase involved in cell wall biosynthesis
MVAAAALQAPPKVTVVHPPDWLVRAAGGAAARLLVFARIAIMERPHVVGGFHLLFNGLAAGLVAPMVGARSLYVSVGGPMEIVDGGIWAENRLFTLLGTRRPSIERGLSRIVGAFDIIVTMGTRAARFFRERNASADIHVIPGGLDLSLYRPSDSTPRADVIFVGRLAAIKRLDVLIEAISRARNRLPAIGAVLVGDGPERPALERMVRALDLSRHVTFAGRQSDVPRWLAGARVFILTSETEGVSLSLMEALACGVPAIVPDVGDLADAVQDGVNGYLIAGRDPAAFADRLVELLTDESTRRRFAAHARQSALGYDRRAIARRWDELLGASSGRPASAEGLQDRAAVHASSQ